MEIVERLLPDEAATAGWGTALGSVLSGEPLAEQSFVVHLVGDLGAGKTRMARAVLRGLGFGGAVKSPTFALLETYNLTNFVVYHIDLYRFSSDDQWFDAGFDDVVASPGLVLLEWPEKAARILAAPDLLLELAPTGEDDQRRLRAGAFTASGRRCLSRTLAAIRPAASPPDAAC